MLAVTASKVGSNKWERRGILRAWEGGQVDSYHLPDPTQKLHIQLPTCLFSARSKTVSGFHSALFLKALILPYKN